MPQVIDLKFPSDCNCVPEGFWSSVDVWIKKPHVVNKRLCGVTQTDVDADALRLLLSSDTVPELSQELGSFLTCEATPDDRHEKQRDCSFSVRTFVPKANSCGTLVHKEVVLRDFDRQRVTFLPFEEDTGGRVCLKKDNIYRIQLVLRDCEDWVLELHVFSPDAWFSDGVVYPKLSWLSTHLLPKLLRWATEVRSSEFRSTLSLLPVDRYSQVYQQLKAKYKSMVKVWPEVTDPEKFVYEDVAIATYLLVLWSEERAEKDLTCRQSFVDLGCGNGLLVHILTNEGHPGKGIDVRKRRIWDMYGPQTRLEEKAITPGESCLFSGTDWLIGNHSDELTPWIPVLAARSSYACRYFVLPCCFFDFYGKYQRRQCQKSQYKEYIDFIAEVSRVSGFNTEEDCLRIPSTKRVCLVGQSRSYEASEEAVVEERRSRFLRSRQPSSVLTALASDAAVDSVGRHGNGAIVVPQEDVWGAGFQPREKVEVVRNCAALPRDLVDVIVLRVAAFLLEMTADDGASSADWNRGGSSTLGAIAGLLEPETLRLLKKECGGLQTLLKNNHQVFRVEGGRVHIRDWRDSRTSRADAKRRTVAPGALKTRLCWFQQHHPQGCPLQAEHCAFAHGPADLRPSSRPEKKKRTES